MPFRDEHSIERNDAAAEGPRVRPSPELSALDAVAVQLRALAENDVPRKDHGIEVMYHFADNEGTLGCGGSLPRYFGFASDLYHFGHFALKFRTRYPSLLNLSSFEIMPALPASGGDGGASAAVPRAQLSAAVVAQDGRATFWEFTLVKCERGALPPCWLTASLLPRQQSGVTF